jgi:hypothetical protein
MKSSDKKVQAQIEKINVHEWMNVIEGRKDEK